MCAEGPARQLFAPLVREVEVVPMPGFSTAAPTPSLINPQYYRNFLALRGGEENLAALDAARDGLRKGTAGNVSRAHPYFWAPFVYVGD